MTTTPTAMPMPIAAPVEREELVLLESLLVLLLAPLAFDAALEDPASGC